MAKTYTVTGAAVVLTDDTGKIRYYYQGAILPSDLPADELKRLTEAGMLATEPEVFVAQVEGVNTAPSTTVSSAPAVDPAAVEPAPVSRSRGRSGS